MRARKRFGQHFLVDEGVLDAIVRHVRPQPTDRMLEIGPGRGALTELLCAELAELAAIELDRDLIAGLEQRFANLRLRQGDVLALDFAHELAAGDWRVVGNLPYNLSSPLLLKLAPHAGLVRDMHFMLQRELAQRLAAQPGTRAWGRLSVMVQRSWAVESLFDVPPDAFLPPPKVDSQVVRLRPLQASECVDIADQNVFARLVTAAFGQRRKTLSNSLRAYDLDFAMAGVRPEQRAETLSVADFARLAATLKAPPAERG